VPYSVRGWLASVLLASLILSASRFSSAMLAQMLSPTSISTNTHLLTDQER